MLWLLIPAHNEIRNLPRLLETWRSNARCLGRELRFIFVNDGSTDGTGDWLRVAGPDIEVLEQIPNQGPGAAFQRGINELLPRLSDSDIVLTLEADNTSDAGIAEKMIAALDAGADLALAACYAEGGAVVGTTLLRKILSAGANFILRTAFRLPQVTTFTSFYRACKPELLRRIAGPNGVQFRLKGFVCMAEMLLLAAVAGARITEIPMVLEGFQRQGPSNMKVLKTIREYLYFLFIRAPLWLRRWSV